MVQIRTRLDKEAERNDMTVARDDGAMATAEERPIDTTLVHTVGLPPTPQRDRNIPATAWVEAPAELLALGVDIDQPSSRTSAASAAGCSGAQARGEGRTRYMAIDADDLAALHVPPVPDGHGEGTGPTRRLRAFRTWKEAARLDVERATATGRRAGCAACRCRRRSATPADALGEELDDASTRPGSARWPRWRSLFELQSAWAAERTIAADHRGRLPGYGPVGDRSCGLRRRTPV
jgi:hypothetical protein